MENNYEKTVEQRVAEEVLQQPMEIQVGTKTYKVAPPSIATLIMCSDEVSKLPKFEIDGDRIAMSVLSQAKNCSGIGMAVATLILGAKNIFGYEQISRPVRKSYLGGIITVRSMQKERVRVDKREKLAKELLEDLTPGQMQQLMTALIKRMELGDFFAITTFLNEINTIKTTRKVEKETTVSGQ